MILLITFYAFLGIFKAFLKILHKIWKNLIFLSQILYFMNYHSKIHIKVSKWQKCDFAHYILRILRHFNLFSKFLYEIWKNLIFLPQISYIITYHLKIHTKVSKWQNVILLFTFYAFLGIFNVFWKYCIKYEKIQFFYQIFCILWPTTQKSALWSHISKISCQKTSSKFCS